MRRTRAARSSATGHLRIVGDSITQAAPATDRWCRGDSSLIVPLSRGQEGWQWRSQTLGKLWGSWAGWVWAQDFPFCDEEGAVLGRTLHPFRRNPNTQFNAGCGNQVAPASPRDRPAFLSLQTILFRNPSRQG